MMKWLLSLMLFLHISEPSIRTNMTFKGKVVVDDEILVGANIICAGKNTKTNAQGNFMIKVNNYSGQDLLSCIPDALI